MPATHNQGSTLHRGKLPPPQRKLLAIRLPSDYHLPTVSHRESVGFHLHTSLALAPITRSAAPRKVFLRLFNHNYSVAILNSTPRPSPTLPTSSRARAGRTSARSNRR